MRSSALAATTERTVNVPLANGLKPSTLAKGQKTSGKLHFDVTGENPDGVVYNNLVQDLLIWVR